MLLKLKGLRMIKKYFGNPGGLYLLWIELVVVAFVFVPLLGLSSFGEGKEPMFYFSILAKITVYGFFVLSMVTSFTVKKVVPKKLVFEFGCVYVQQFLYQFRINPVEKKQMIFMMLPTMQNFQAKINIPSKLLIIFIPKK